MNPFVLLVEDELKKVSDKYLEYSNNVKKPTYDFEYFKHVKQLGIYEGEMNRLKWVLDNLKA